MIVHRTMKVGLFDLQRVRFAPCATLNGLDCGFCYVSHDGLGSFDGEGGAVALRVEWEIPAVKPEAVAAFGVGVADDFDRADRAADVYRHAAVSLLDAITNRMREVGSERGVLILHRFGMRVPI